MKIVQKNINIAIFAGLLWFLADLLTKKTAVVFEKPVILIKGWFHFTYQTNRGIAFGILLPGWVQVIGSVIILVLLFYISRDFVFPPKKRLFLKPALFGIIVGGAVGNLMNRITLGHVIDFIALKPIPVFNLADVGITIGLIILFLLSLGKHKT